MAVPSVGADVSLRTMEFPLVVLMVPKLVWLARIIPAEEPVSTSELNVLFSLIGSVTVPEFFTRPVAPPDAVVIGGVETMIREPVLRLRFDAVMVAIELVVVAPLSVSVPPEVLLAEFSGVKGGLPAVPSSGLLVCAATGSTKNPATSATMHCRWQKDGISDFLPIVGLAGNLFSRAFQPKSMRQIHMGASLVR